MFENKVMVFWWTKKVPCKRPVCSSWVFFPTCNWGGDFCASSWRDEVLAPCELPFWEWSRGSILENFIRSQKVWSKKKNRLFGGFNMFQCIFYKHTVAGWNGLLRFTPVCNEIKLWTSEHIQARIGSWTDCPYLTSYVTQTLQGLGHHVPKNDSFGTF